MNDLKPAEIMERHALHRAGDFDSCVVTSRGPDPDQERCQVYLLAARVLKLEGSTITPEVRAHYAGFTPDQAHNEAHRVRRDRDRAITNSHRGGYREPVTITDADRLAVLTELHGSL